ncbi:MAG: GNAT family N-acetyltransferase [Lewinellaceae bacterium]|nr:GNAT family N-acetyltransferase [Lewinellaceae bacterium]MCB9291031.1 GNAT family N-acetyltransferase [Lewinellaceae bacterium]
MLEITTSRLRLIALNLEQLHLLTDGLGQLQEQLGLEPFEVRLSPEFDAEYIESIHDFCLPQVEAHPQDYAWFTHWIIVHRKDNCRIGGIGLGGLPDERGESMIGYFVDERYAGQGLATEAAGALCDWLGKDGRLQAIIATVPVGHAASERILQKIGFEMVTVDEGVGLWRMEVK